MHVDSLNAIADIFSNAFTLKGKCRFPPYITAALAKEWFDSWMLINEQRAGRRGWSRQDSATDSAPVAPSVALFRALAQPNHSRSRRRYFRARPLSFVAARDLWKDERHTVEDSEDEDIPVELRGVHMDLP